ncbi:MAG: hypothetical protein U1E56_08385 [Bauldia sp.]
MFKLIAHAFAAIVLAKSAGAAPDYQTGRVTFFDNASGQMLVDNQLVTLNGDPDSSGVRLGDEVDLIRSQNALVAVLQPRYTGAISRPEPVLAEPLDLSVTGTVTGIIEETGTVVLNHSIVLTLDPSTAATLRLGELAQTRYHRVADRKFAGVMVILG